VPGDHGVHGRFDGTAKPRSGQVWMNLHRGLTAAVAALTLAGMAFAFRRR
jgi:hypothetical protein